MSKPFNPEDARVGRMKRIDYVGDIHTDPSRGDGVLARLDSETGFLHLDGRLTRTGVFRYSDGEGNTWGELRVESEVFDADSMRSFQLVPVTNDHPDRFVDLDNVKSVQVGTVGDGVRRDGPFMTAPLVVTDARTIVAIQQGKCQLSNGYTAVVIEQRGDVDGVPYEFVQTNIRGNHVAIVDKGRAGPECALIARGDAAFAEVSMTVLTAHGRAEAEHRNQQSKRDKALERGDQDAVAKATEIMGLLQAAMKTKNQMLIEAALTAATAVAAGNAPGPEETEPEADPEPEPEPEATPDVSASPQPPPPAQDSAAAEKARADALQTELAAQRKRIDADNRARRALERSALRVMPELEPRIDAMTSEQVMAAVVLAVQPSAKGELAPNKADSGYLRGRYDVALALHAQREESVREQYDAPFQAHMDGAAGEVDLDALHAAHVTKLDGWGRLRRDRKANGSAS